MSLETIRILLSNTSPQIHNNTVIPLGTITTAGTPVVIPNSSYFQYYPGTTILAPGLFPSAEPSRTFEPTPSDFDKLYLMQLETMILRNGLKHDKDCPFEKCNCGVDQIVATINERRETA